MLILHWILGLASHSYTQQNIKMHVFAKKTKIKFKTVLNIH